MTRLYLNESLEAKRELTLNPDHSHYLARVLRYQLDDIVNVFNENNGEWQSKVTQITKKAVVIQIEQQLRLPNPTRPLWLAFAPLKNDAMGFLIEKATELGVTHLQPILTERCNTQRLNLERLQKNAIEASQQCERLDVPVVLEAVSLVSWDKRESIEWYVALERADAEPIQKVLQQSKTSAWGFIIGPEGGFTSQEVTLFSKDKITPINLGPRILRAETAALYVLAIAGSIKDTLTHSNQL